MNTERAATPPLEQYEIAHEFNNYTKKSRHGHGKDVVDENDIRQVAGCVPIDTQNNRVLLISSRKKKDAWVLPKGGWEQDETQQHAAQRETWEEAGIKGQIVHQLGVFEEYTNKKRKLKAHHWIFEMHIDEVVKKFPERKKRERRWFTLHEALIATKSHRYIQEALLKSSLNPEVAAKEAEIAATTNSTTTTTTTTTTGVVQEAPPSPRGSISDMEDEKRLKECTENNSPSLLNSIWPILG